MDLAAIVRDANKYVFGGHRSWHAICMWQSELWDHYPASYIPENGDTREGPLTLPYIILVRLLRSTHYVAPWILSFDGT